MNAKAVCRRLATAAHHEERVGRIQRKHKNGNFSGALGGKRRHASIANGAQVLLQHGAVQVKSLGARTSALGVNLHHSSSLDGARDGERNGGIRLRSDGERVLHVSVPLTGQFQHIKLACDVVYTQTSTPQAQRFVVPKIMK